MLAKKALELSALAFARWAMDDRAPAAEQTPRVQSAGTAEMPPQSFASDPLAFVQEAADERTRVYRAHDEEGEMFAAFYTDGRIRVADERYRFAGIVQNAHAHLVQIDGEARSELFVRVTPSGSLQLELRDGPYDGRVLACTNMGANAE